MAIGTVSNQNGEFKLSIPDSLGNCKITFSHLGYISQEIESALFADNHPLISLEPKIIPIQEVVIRRTKPSRLIEEMRSKRKSNYPQKPVCHTIFYREGIELRKRFVSLTEAVFKVYKTPYQEFSPTDQVKLLKMRQILNLQEKDTLITKLKSGINACLILDLMKNLPNFIDKDFTELYNYAHTDISVVDNRLVNVVSFEQKQGIDLPLYKGELYIDMDNSALIKAHFGINPKHIKQATHFVIERKSRNLNISLQHLTYTISYKPWNGVYYIHHIRGDLDFKIKKRRQVFNTTTLHAWYEMITCKTDTLQVEKFTHKEILPTRTVFSETHFTYDETFWGDFNIILPEEELNEAIRKISAKIEETK